MRPWRVYIAKALLTISNQRIKQHRTHCNNAFCLGADRKIYYTARSSITIMNGKSHDLFDNEETKSTICE